MIRVVFAIAACVLFSFSSISVAESQTKQEVAGIPSYSELEALFVEPEVQKILKNFSELTSNRSEEIESEEECVDEVPDEVIVPGKPGSDIEKLILKRDPRTGKIRVTIVFRSSFIPNFNYSVDCDANGLCRLRDAFGSTICTLRRTGGVLHLFCESSILNLHRDCDMYEEDRLEWGTTVRYICALCRGRDSNGNPASTPLSCTRKSQMRPMDEYIPREILDVIPVWAPVLPEILPSIFPPPGTELCPVDQSQPLYPMVTKFALD